MGSKCQFTEKSSCGKLLGKIIQGVIGAAIGLFIAKSMRGG